jgi:thiamine-phosphate pyrophosphorylase
MSPPEKFLRYYITDRGQLGSMQALIGTIARNLTAGVEWIQLRERELAARDLFALTQAVLQLPNPHGTKILVNDRTDVALAAGAAGVHLRGHSIAASRIRAMAPADFLIGVSCHSVDDVAWAESEGASFAVIAPVYETLGKGPAVGLEMLAAAARSVRIPVLALGGVNESRIAECLQAGAAGIAGISLFQRAASWEIG